MKKTGFGFATLVFLQVMYCANGDIQTNEGGAEKSLKTGTIAELPIATKMFETPREYFSSSIQKKVYTAYKEKKSMGRLPANTLTPDECVAYEGVLTTYVYVPPAYDGTEHYGVYVHNSPGKTGIRPSEPWQKVMQKLKLIYISPNHGGNDVSDLRRVVLAIDSLATVKQLYSIDDKRVYVGGLSGGGYIGMLCQMLYPEFFSGAISHAAQSYLPGSSSSGHFAGLTLSDAQRSPRNQVGWVVISGSKDMNYETIKKTSAAWEKAKFNYKFIDKEGMGHENASAEALEEALVFVGAGLTGQTDSAKNGTAVPKAGSSAVLFDSKRPSRIWTAQMGAVLEASLLRTEGGFAFFKRTDGTDIKVLIASLIEADQAYILSVILKP